MSKNQQKKGPAFLLKTFEMLEVCDVSFLRYFIL